MEFTQLNYSLFFTLLTAVEAGIIVILAIKLKKIRDESNYDVGTLKNLKQELANHKLAEETQRFLAEANAKISSSLDQNAILKKVATLCVPRLADWCMISLEENDNFNLVVAVHKNITKTNVVQNFYNKYILDRKAQFNVYKTSSSQKSQLMQKVPKKLLSLKGSHNLLKKYKIQSLLIVPLEIRKKIIGALILVTAESGRKLDSKSMEIAENLASRAAFAVDNAQLYLHAQEAIKAREEFLSIASHELKTPLTSLLLQLQMVLRSLINDPMAKLSIERLIDLLKNAEKQSKKLSTLISNLLNVSRITGGRLNLQRKEIDLSEIVEKVRGDLEEQIDESGSQVSVITPVKIVGRWDGLQIEQVVTNLLLNAVKYGLGKSIEIKVERGEGDSAKLIVHDHGIGIDSKQKDNIFKPFSRAAKNPEYQGLGVGLYIVKEIVDAHNGKIKVDSEPDQGSTFTVILPLA